MSTPEPGIYRKGLSVRAADTAAEAVALVFDGFAKQTAEVVADGVDYRDLQEQAKALGIPANQAKAALAEAIANHVPADGEVAVTSNLNAPDLSYVSPIGDGTDEVEDDEVEDNQPGAGIHDANV